MTPRQWAHTALTVRPRWCRPPTFAHRRLLDMCRLTSRRTSYFASLHIFLSPPAVDESFAWRTIRAPLLAVCAKADAAADDEQRGRTHITNGHADQLRTDVMVSVRRDCKARVSEGERAERRVTLVASALTAGRCRRPHNVHSSHCSARILSCISAMRHTRIHNCINAYSVESTLLDSCSSYARVHRRERGRHCAHARAIIDASLEMKDGL
jgi:hypothetical protein